MNFEFATAARIIFGAGTVNKAAAEAAKMGRHALIVTGKNPDRAVGLIRVCEQENITVTTFKIMGEPTVDAVISGAETAEKEKCDLVMAVGGGSVIDGGKAIAALMTNPGDILSYLEVIGKGRSIENPPAPFIALPTTAGTGAEVTRNAVLQSSEHQVKVSMRSPLMLPRLAVIDPELTCSMPPDVTAESGLDALTQLLEAFVCSRPNPIVDGLCREGLIRAGSALERVFLNGNDMEAREDMCIASLFGGLALANAKLGAVHGLAAPLGGMFSIPHGAVCAALLPHVMRINAEALMKQSPNSPFLDRFDETARLLTGDVNAEAEEGVRWIEMLCGRLNIKPLNAFDVDPARFPEVIQKAQNASSMKGNPIKLSDEELMKILEV